MKLRNVGADDLWIYKAQNVPEMMEHLGGPPSMRGIADKLRRDVAATQADKYWVLVIVPDDDPSTAAGTVGVWSHEEHGGRSRLIDDSAVSSFCLHVSQLCGAPADRSPTPGNQSAPSTCTRARDVDLDGFDRRDVRHAQM